MRIAVLLMTVALLLPPPVFADPRDCAKELTAASADPFGPEAETFSFEIEVDLERTPRVLNYYRLAGWTDAAWLALPIGQRVELGQTVIRSSVASKKRTVFEALAQTPPFLSRRLLKDASGQVEAADNQVSVRIQEVSEELEWFWTHIGPGSIHGHVAFHRNRPAISGAENYLKFDSEISMARALRRSFDKGQSTGAQPGRILGYPYLGSMDLSVYSTFQEAFSVSPFKKHFKNPKTKFFYGTTFRPDLYGPHRVGFEIRNCLGNKECIERKMRNLQRQLQTQFAAFRGIEPGPLLSKAHYWKTTAKHPKLWPLIYGNSIHLRRLHSWFVPAAAKYAHRFLFPYLAWETHPLIQLLDLAQQAEFQAKQRIALIELTRELESLSTLSLSAADRLGGSYLAVARWAHATRLDEFLEQGMRTLDAEYDQR